MIDVDIQNAPAGFSFNVELERSRRGRYVTLFLTAARRSVIFSVRW